MPEKKASEEAFFILMQPQSADSLPIAAKYSINY
jgi:hypothetical protein